MHILTEWIDYDHISDLLEEFDCSITEDTMNQFFDKKLKNFDGLEDEEIAGVRLLMKMIYGIKSDLFKWDW